MFAVKIIKDEQGIVPVSLPKNAFVVRVYAVFGDGDGYENVNFKPVPNVPGFEIELEEAYELVKLMYRSSPDIDEGFSYLENFDKWLGEDNKWPFDPMSGDDEIFASCDGCEIVYYDENSVILPVVVTAEKS